MRLVESCLRSNNELQIPLQSSDMTPDPDGVNMSHLQIVDVDIHDFTNQGKSLETSGVAKIDKVFHHLKITVLSALVQVQDKHVIQIRHDSVCH